MAAKVLLADMSKAHSLRLALCDKGRRPQGFRQFPIDNSEEFEVALKTFLHEESDPELAAAAFSATGWEVGGGLSMPNFSFRIERSRIRDLLKIQRLHLVNDCVSNALSIQCLKEAERVKICGGAGDEDLVKGLIGAGVGLGMAGLSPDDMGRWSALPCEGGHSDLPVRTEREFEIFLKLQAKYGHVSCERAVSIPGLSAVYGAISALELGHEVEIEPEEVIIRAQAQEPFAVETLEVITQWLAGFASDTSLMLGARGGIYLCGDLLRLMGALFDQAAFAKRYCDKGVLSDYLSEIPVYLITAEAPEILGLTTLFD